MTKLLEDFYEIRKVSTPWCVVRTTDYMSTILTLLRVRLSAVAKVKDGKEELPLAGFWTCVDGIQSPIRNNIGQVLSEEIPQFASFDMPPFAVLKAAYSELPEEAVLFMVLPDNSVWDTSTGPNALFLIQAMSNLRDKFKANGCCLVILGPDPQLPPFLKEDVPILDDPLPNLKELSQMVLVLVSEKEKKYKEKEPKFKFPADAEDCERAASFCLGMPRFPAEEAVSRKIKRTGIDFDGLRLSRQLMVEQSSTGALKFERETWTFDQIGGQESFKGFMGSLFGGPKDPKLVVRIDEIDKSITSASTGAVADNTGVSQDILKTLLSSLEDNNWMGLLAVGPPGSGKTLASICTGNQFGVQTLAMDLGAVKASLVGESEARIRRTIQVIKSMGGSNVLFMATANRLDTMPPELLRRFWLGTWFWDLPTKEEKKQIWAIQRKRFNTSEADKAPDDEHWTGSDIRNACQMAWVCNSSLIEAAERITVSGIVSKLQIEQLRDLAVRSGFRSANQNGAYQRPKSDQPARKVRV